jgi:hypothetical protein
VEAASNASGLFEIGGNFNMYGVSPMQVEWAGDAKVKSTGLTTTLGQLFKK